MSTAGLEVEGGVGKQFPAPYLAVEGISHAFAERGDGRFVLSDISFTVARGEFVCLLGQSGCGKTTLLNILAGFLTPTSGRCLLEGRAINGPGPDRGVVFQEDALFPWLTLRENIAFGLKAIPGGGQRATEVDRFLGLVGLDGYGDYLPRQISGGMKQRAALARVLIRSPRMLLMDEPFGALDAQSRETSQELLQNLALGREQTILFITHDVREAVTLADRVLVLGRQSQGLCGEEPILLPRPRDPDGEMFHTYCRRLRERLRG
ncbi:MAG: ABC transporter ATP-binding protein [Desulforhopalus sp.]|nr:ABC transporter ATP-binding protein [Desulforhopalus sp.]